MEEAAFATIGAIALQSIHQADIKAGEHVGVIGAGLIGQIVVQLATIAGARVVTFDLIEKRLELAKKFGAIEAINAREGGPKAKIDEITAGVGLDKVIVAASSKNPAPLVTAFEIVRDKGRVVLLGAVPIEIPRGPFYMKEVDFFISRSYGAGRYDDFYEVEGNDYLVKQVRWTENRNMKLILDLVQQGKLDVKSLITDIMPVERATEAYQKLRDHPDDALAILLDFPSQERGESEEGTEGSDGRKHVIGLIGCGAFARDSHLPHLVTDNRCKIKAIATKSKASASNVDKAYSPGYVTTNYKDLLKDDEIDTIFIYTRHGQHAPLAIEAMKAGKNVFCEKPVGITLEECKRVVDMARETGKLYQVGFNRRLSPFVIKAKELLETRDNPIIMTYRVAAPYVPSDHWVYDPKDGGGRVVGEACHFLDLILHLVNDQPAELVARGGSLSNKNVDIIDSFSCTITFTGGSVATLIYTDLNAKEIPKERCEIFSGSSAIIIDDFKKMEVGGFLAGNKKLPHQDKGHGNEMRNVIGAAMGKDKPFITPEEALASMELCFHIEHSIRENVAIPLGGEP